MFVSFGTQNFGSCMQNIRETRERKGWKVQNPVKKCVNPSRINIFSPLRKEEQKSLY